VPGRCSQFAANPLLPKFVYLIPDDIWFHTAIVPRPTAGILRESENLLTVANVVPILSLFNLGLGRALSELCLHLHDL